MLNDCRYALRTFAASRGLTVAAILSLALAIGANTAIFSVASALLIRPLPYADPGRLTILWNRSPGLGIEEDWFSTAQYFDIKESASSFEQVAIAIGSNLNLTGDGEPERIGTIRVSADLLPMLGAHPVIGRTFTDADAADAAAGTAILHHGTWLRRYGGDPHVIGRSLILNGQPYQIIGVMPKTFTLRREVMPTLGGAEEAAILVPLRLGPKARQTRNGEDYNIVARLKVGASLGEAQAQMNALTARLREQHPDFYPPNGGLTFSVVPLQQQVVGDVTRAVILLMAAVGVVLLIACANVANLLLSRALSRKKEIAVRAALGASRMRIVRQLLTESVLLSLAGGAVGLALGFGGVRAIHALGTKSVPRLHDVGIDGVVLLFTCAVSIAAGIIFGLAPATRLGKVDLHDSLKTDGRTSSGTQALWGRGGRLRSLLVGAELALSVVVLIAAGLLVRSFARVHDVSPGFNPSNVLTLELTMAGRKYTESPRVYETYRTLWDRLHALPQVTAAGGVTALPLSQMFAWGPITVEGRNAPAGEKFINVDIRTIAGEYFRAMEIPLVRGRFFNDNDTRETPMVVVVDQRMADELWPGQDPVGKRIRTGGFDVTPDTPWMTVVGVAGRVRQYALDGGDPRIAMYLWHKQRPSRALNVVVRTTAPDPVAIAPEVRQQIRDIDADLPVYNVRTMEQRVSESLARRRFAMTLLTLFAVLALALASIGTYGVIAYLVSQGTRDIGIRLALGATPSDVVGMVLRSGMAVVAGGVAAGLAIAWVATRYIQSLLFNVTPTDSLTFASIAGLLALVAFVATYAPARRAARVDPVTALRSE